MTCSCCCSPPSSIALTSHLKQIILARMSRWMLRACNLRHAELPSALACCCRGHVTSMWRVRPDLRLDAKDSAPLECPSISAGKLTTTMSRSFGAVCIPSTRDAPSTNAQCSASRGFDAGKLRFVSHVFVQCSPVVVMPPPVNFRLFVTSPIAFSYPRPSRHISRHMRYLPMRFMFLHDSSVGVTFRGMIPRLLTPFFWQRVVVLVHDPRAPVTSSSSSRASSPGCQPLQPCTSASFPTRCGTHAQRKFLPSNVASLLSRPKRGPSPRTTAS